MSVLDIPRSILRFQYRIVRIPLDLFESNVVQTWSTEAPARLAYERAVGTLDHKVGKILGDAEVRDRGQDKVDRVDNIGLAKTLDEQADAAETEAKTKLETARRTAEQERDAAAKSAREAAENARAEAEQRKAEAEEEADRKAAAKKKQADDAAAARVKAAEDAERKQKEQIDRVEKAASAPAESELADAAERQEEAEDKKEEAARIEKLFIAEKNAD